MFIPNPNAKITNQIISKLLVYFTIDELEEMDLVCEKVCENEKEDVDNYQLPPCIFRASKSSNFKYTIRIKNNNKTKCYGYANSIEEAKKLVLKEKNKIYKDKLNQLVESFSQK